MKKFITTLMSFLLVAGILAQETSGEGKVTIQEDENKTTVRIGDDGVVIVEEVQDTTKIKIGNKGVTIIEDEKGTRVDWDDLNEKDENGREEDEEEEKKKRNKKFKPHWAGIEMGINNYLNNDLNMELPPANSYMDLNTSRSWNFNVNFMEYGIGLGTDKVGLVTGLGLEWSNYHFDDGNVIEEDENGNIVPSYPGAFSSVQRAKLQTTFLTAPLLLEFQIPMGKKRMFISGGVIGGVKLGSKTKRVYTRDGDKFKDKVKDDFNINALRYGFTARIGYRNLKLFANYYPTPLFENGKGPELYPFSVGLTLLSF